VEQLWMAFYSTVMKWYMFTHPSFLHVKENRNEVDSLTGYRKYEVMGAEWGGRSDSLCAYLFHLWYLLKEAASVV
jgi:hypothetical protein